MLIHFVVFIPKAITERSLDQFEIVQGREY